MTAWATPLRLGLPVSFDGDQFTVAEIEGSRVMQRRTGTAGAPSWRQVELVALLSHPSTRILTAAPEPQAAVTMIPGSLDAGEDDALTARYGHVQEVRTGCQHGCAELALSGEPRPQYAAGMPMMSRYQAKAAELGVGVSCYKGTNAFTGSTKGKRSIANRPQGAYGRLRATRPGEYVVLDTNRLDVFAMEPVTCRWVQ